MSKGHFEERRLRRASFRTPIRSELSGLMASIFLPAFRNFLAFFSAICGSPARIRKRFYASCIFKPAMIVNCAEPVKLPLNGDRALRTINRRM